MNFGYLSQAIKKPKCRVCKKKLEKDDYRMQPNYPAQGSYHLNCYMEHCKKKIKEYYEDIKEMKTKFSDKLKEEKEVLVLRGI